MLQHLVNLVSGLGVWAYVIIFLAVFLESSAFLGFVVPGETLAILGGFLANQGNLDLGDVMMLVCVGAIAGDTVGYEVGRHLGRPALLRYGRWVGMTEKRLQHVEDFFHSHGGKAVLVGRLTAVLRALVPFVAGSSRMRYLRFLLYNAIGGILWGVACTLAGYLVGASWHVVAHWVGRAGGVVGGVIIGVLLVMWLRHHLRQSERFQAWWGRVRQRPGIARALVVMAPVARFLHHRLSPRRHYGLCLTLGVLVSAGAWAAFALIASAVTNGRGITRLDPVVVEWMHENVEISLSRAMAVLTWLGAPAVTLGLSLLVAAGLAYWRRWVRLVLFIVAVPVGIELNALVVKPLFHRARPPHGLSHLFTASYSFPSGHAVGAMLFWGFVAASLGPMLVTDARWRRVIVLAGAAIVLVVGFSRLALGVHYLSDVLGGYSEGLGWLALWLTVSRAIARPAPCLP